MYIKQPSFETRGSLVYQFHRLNGEATKIEADKSVLGFEWDPLDGDFVFVNEKIGRELIAPAYLWDWVTESWVTNPTTDPGDAFMYRSSPSDDSGDETDSDVDSEDASDDSAVDEPETLVDADAAPPADDESEDEDAELDS